MPQKSKWKTWDLIKIDQDSYLDSPGFLDSSLYKREPALRDGMCLGASIQWCRRLLTRPGESPLERMNQLETNLEDVASTQFLHMETIDYIPERLWWPQHYGEYLEAMCRVSRLKFNYAFDITQPCSSNGITKLIGSVKSNCIYKLKPTLPDGLAHALTLVTSDIGPIKLFDVLFGEFEFDQSRLEQFLHDYWKSWTDDDFFFDQLLGYEVSRSH